MGAARDTLFLLQPGFEDPAYPGKRFYCWHCALMEGVLASFPEGARRLDAVRVPWPRPRQAVAALVGEANQNLPLLVLGAGTPDDPAAQDFAGTRFIAGKDDILAALSRRHGFPHPHP
ncbi:MAG: DUF3088 domain-containing protein [Rhodospirillaceae bacterium]|nr:DUF3088 domain-containing protein [Rhodospirillaceae bacterium]